MAEICKAKLVDDGEYQRVMLPAGFEFEGDEVYIWRDKRTQDVILSMQPEPQP